MLEGYLHKVVFLHGLQCWARELILQRNEILDSCQKSDQMHGGWLHILQKWWWPKMLTTMVEIPKSLGVALKKKKNK